MFEKEQMDDWITDSAGYCCQTLKAYASNPVWTADPNNAPYAKASETLRPNGYAGPLGYASAAVMADYVLVDMFAEAVTGQQTPQAAMERAEKRANRYYRGLIDWVGRRVTSAGPPSYAAQSWIGRMAELTASHQYGRSRRPAASASRQSRGALGFLFMLPAAVLLLLFLTYPLGLGVWLGFTDETIGRPGIFIGIENYQYLWSDSVFWLSVFNTLLYTIVASA